MKYIKFFKALSVIVLLIGMSGCAFTPQKAKLNPTVNTSASNVGNGSSVYLNVVDERTSKVLGHRGSGYGAAAEITSSEDLAILVNRELSNGLKNKGFNLSEKNNATSILNVELRGLEYTTSTGFWTGGVNVAGAIKVRAKHGSSDLEKLYRYEKEERVVVVPTAETNEKWLNMALSDILAQLLNDQELIKLLSKNQ